MGIRSWDWILGLGPGYRSQVGYPHLAMDPEVLDLRHGLHGTDQSRLQGGL